MPDRTDEGGVLSRHGEVLVLSDYAGEGGLTTGGAGIAVLESYRALRTSGFAARLLTGFALSSGDDDGGAIASLGGADLRAGSTIAALKTVYNPAARRALAPVLAEADPASTVVVLHQWTRYLSPAAIMLLRRFPLMVYMHDYFWACPTGNYFNFARSEPCTLRPGSLACITSRCDRAGYAHKAIRLARHAALALASRPGDRPTVFLHISEQARRVAEPLLPQGRHAVVYNPLPLPQLAPNVDAGAAAVGGPRYDIGYFGRLEPEKGIARLLAELSRRGMTGLFVGEGRLADEIEHSPGMTRLPWQTQQAVAVLMRECAMVALPSLWPETWGLIVPEAMAQRVPVLVSTRAGASELVDRFGGGLTIDPDRPGALGEALDRLKAKQAPAPLDGAGESAMRELLSPRRHAAQIARLAHETWGIAVGGAQPTGPTPVRVANA